MNKVRHILGIQAVAVFIQREMHVLRPWGFNGQAIHYLLFAIVYAEDDQRYRRPRCLPDFVVQRYARHVAVPFDSEPLFSEIRFTIAIDMAGIMTAGVDEGADDFQPGSVFEPVHVFEDGVQFFPG